MRSLYKNISSPALNWMKEYFFIRRMNSWPGWIVMALLGIGLAFLSAFVNPKLPLLAAGSLVGLLYVLACIRYPEFAYYAFIYSILTFTLPARVAGINLPLGPLIEGSGYLAALSILAAQYRNRVNSRDFWKTPLSIMMIVITLYLFLEAFNPEIGSREGWFNYFRKQILYMIFYYISFLMLDSIEKIRRFIKFWIYAALLVALWGIKQQWFGFTAYEDAWIHSDPNIASLLFQGGMFRKFSIMPDPASYGVLVTSSAVLTLVLAVRTPSKKLRNKLLFVTIIFIVSSGYSGTRTCNAMLAGGILAYGIFTLNEKRTIRVLLTAIFAGLFLFLGPFRNTPVIARASTTFASNKDASHILRDVNRHNVQPYVYAHPIGGGLQTCGEEGLRFYPGHPLAGFPPDSGYTKTMVEQGWIGLALNLIFFFIVLQTGIQGFFNARKPEIKTLYMALNVCFFSVAVGQYSQLAIAQYPQYLIFLATLVIFYKLKEYDKQPPETAVG
ncbi:MAG: hypothetical protein KGO82_08505 [Bacteroidota bacterium]|nr:hypothetical protein [Bacteroidota bacterium]